MFHHQQYLHLNSRFRKLTQEEIEAENQSESEVEDEVPDENNGIKIGM